MTTYKNPFHSDKYQGSYPEITTDVIPVEYKGYLIYNRIDSPCEGGDVWDIVENGVCVGMMAGLDGAKRRIDDPGLFPLKKIC